jgi:hypothetical protein
MAHPETLLPMTTIEDPTERFISVVKFYLSGWHIKPPYVLIPLPAPRFPPFFFSFAFLERLWPPPCVQSQTNNQIEE